MSRSGGEKGNRRATDEVSNVRHIATALRARGSVDRKSLPLPEREQVQLAQGGGEVRPRPLGHLLEGCFVLGVKGDGQRRVEKPLPAPLHLVAQAAHVLQGDLRL